jgi:uncharacterized protein (DUF1800 family)
MSTSHATKLRAANRFGQGASAADLAAMGDDPRGWLHAQLDAKAAEPAVAVPSAAAAIAESQRQQRERARQRQRPAAAAMEMQPGGTAMDTPARRQAPPADPGQQRQREQVTRESLLRLRHCVETKAPLRERLVHFWSNHFSVSRNGKQQIATACTAYEQEAIRAHLDGSFADMLLAVESHPVMLFYLDNAQSTGPHSRAGRRRDAGLNENLAREILELHTLGVDGGYTQADVTSLARIITGWTVAQPRLPVRAAPGTFVYADIMHEPGAHDLLGVTYRDAGVEQGRRALAALAQHPATARHVATKLVRHFVADEPPADAIARVERAFRDSDGHLPTVHAAVVELDAAWDAGNAKLKSPHDLLVSAWRGLALRDYPPQLLLNPLRALDHVPFSASSPAGWPDVATHWGSPNMLMQRLDWGIAVGRRLGGMRDVTGALPTLFDAEHDAGTVAAVRRAESRAQALSLALAAPAFQWR